MTHREISDFVLSFLFLIQTFLSYFRRNSPKWPILKISPIRGTGSQERRDASAGRTTPCVGTNISHDTRTDDDDTGNNNLRTHCTVKCVHPVFMFLTPKSDLPPLKHDDDLTVSQTNGINAVPRETHRKLLTRGARKHLWRRRRRESNRLMGRDTPRAILATRDTQRNVYTASTMHFTPRRLHFIRNYCHVKRLRLSRPFSIKFPKKFTMTAFRTHAKKKTSCTAVSSGSIRVYDLLCTYPYI